MSGEEVLGIAGLTLRVSALATLAEGIEDGADSSQVRRSARLLQEYEQLFWTTVHRRRKGSSE